MKPFGFAAAALAAFALASSAQAQNQPTPSPAKLAAARHLLAVMHTERVLDQTTAAVLSTIDESLPADQREAMREIRQSVIDAMHDFQPRLIEASAVIYANGFTDEEIAAMDRFYSSPIGQSVLTKLPAVNRQILPFVQAETPALLEKALRRMCKKTACSPEQREIYKDLVDAMKTATARQPS
ncbi:MAG TPA: DUF2059 domain-containing protein [Caulobacteraceae bacterium]|nr:DUF2059 domain-containing protein [Caulobacteraceae bacterium]